MQKITRRICMVSFLVLALALVAPAQLTTTGIRGIVKDSSGAVVPNVTLTLTDQATQTTKTTQSGPDGSFVFANIMNGTYDVSAAMTGFQTAILTKVAVDTGRITDVTMELKVGAPTEKVEVSATGVQLQTTSNEVGTTIVSNQIQTLPYTSRDALNFALYMPGAQSTSGYSTFNGLPNASMNISLDGMNNNSQRFKSGGTSFYEFAPARLDAIEEVTVSTTGLGAEAAGQGAMQIRFTTKRGTDKYRFHLLYQTANEDFNANSYFNKAQGVHRSKTRTANYAGSMGGPLFPWIHFLKNKAFFFINYERLPQPGSTWYSTTMLMPEDLSGNFTYYGTDGQNHTVNVLNIVKANGCPLCTTAIDPTVMSMLNTINGTAKSGAVFATLPIANQPYWQTIRWNFATDTETQYPTARVDYMFTNKVTWHGTWNMRHANTLGNPNYPDGPFPSNNAYKINTPVTTNTVDWTITPHMLSTTMFGTQSNMEYFYNPSDIHQWSQYGDRNISLMVTSLIPNNTPWKRNNPVWQINENLTWVKGSHSFLMGEAFLRTSFYEQSWGSAGILNISFGATASQDPVNNIISTAAAGPTGALPYINTSSTTDVNNAKALYAMLTGRISGYSTSYNVDETSHAYKPFSPSMQRFAFNTISFFFQDSWRVAPNLTVNYGLRWEMDGVVHNTNGVDSWPDSALGPSSGMFNYGQVNTSYNPQLTINGYPYKKDLINPAPNFGFAWNPSGGESFLGKLIGHNKTVIAGSYGINYYNEGLNSISNLVCCNPGSTQSSNASAAIAAAPGSYNLAGAAPAMVTNPSSFSFPVSISKYPVTGGGMTWYYANPDLKTPYVQNWVFRIQREVARGTVLDVRYVGNKATHIWHYQNINETNIFENGFLKEFQNAQSNLAIANGMTVAQMTAFPTPTLKTQNFSNQGLAGQVNLPIFTALFGANGTNAALSTSSGFGSSTYIGYLQTGQAGNFASSMASTSTGTNYCRLVGSNFGPCVNGGYTANNGYPMNFFRPNPYANSINYQDDNANSNYNALQIHLRRAFNRGLMMDAAYTWSHTLGTISNLSGQTSDTTWWTYRPGNTVNYGPTPFDHRHGLTIYGTYDLPIGKGKWLNVNNKVLNGIVGGWTAGSTNQITSGAQNLLTSGRYNFNAWADSGINFGNGMDINQLLQRTSTPAAYTYTSSNSVYASGTVIGAGQFDHYCNCFHTSVSDIVQANGSVQPAYYQPNAASGAIGPLIYYTGKTSFSFNVSLAKQFHITERMTLKLWAEASNFLNHPFFSQGSISTTSTSFGNITGASGTRTVLVRGYLDF